MRRRTRRAGTRPLTFVRLAVHNATSRRVRFAFTALAVAIGVLAVVTFRVVTYSLQSSELALMQTGRADFTVAQRGLSDLLSSNVDSAALDRIRTEPGVAAATGVLVGTTRLNADNPLFLEIGIAPADLAEFGVTVVRGQAFAADSASQMMLGYRAAANLGVGVGDELTVDGVRYRVVGLYSTGQALGDAGAMFPLIAFQAHQRQAGEVSLVFVRVVAGASIADVRTRIEHDFPQLVTVRTTADFGRADRSFALMTAADRGSTVLALLVGGVVVLSTMTITFVERTREFGLLRAIGWPARRVTGLVVSEALVVGAAGAVIGSVLAIGTVYLLGRLPDLVGVLQISLPADAFARAFWTAAGMSLFGGLVPGLRAARLSPVEALRDE